ncbi:hypothetical protein AB0M54_11460 [Actinoplanes sp. NPDC051470]|uniref:HAAS signaling domain-containing protein n=1 Tax=Actinoplanes sp. NPDC051470 TaxID=3157224 RepID=UPI003423075F
MSIQKTDVVGEYLREVELRLSGLPLLQRHELLADLSAHIETARERGAYSDSEMIEVLQRLGSPEAIAAAAYWEAGPQPPRATPTPPPPPAPRGGVPPWVIFMITGIFVVFLLGLGAAVAMVRVSDAPAPAQDMVEQAPVKPDPLPTR